MTPFRALVAVLLAPAVVLIGLARPAALLALVVLAALVAAVARVGLWLLGDLVAGNADLLAVRAGVGTFAVAAGVAAGVLVLGPASVPLLAVGVVVVAVGAAPSLVRPARPTPWPCDGNGR